MKGKVKVMFHTQIGNEALEITPRLARRHRHQNERVDDPCVWLALKTRGCEVSIFTSPSELRRLAAELLVIAERATAPPTSCPGGCEYGCSVPTDTKGETA